MDSLGGLLKAYPKVERHASPLWFCSLGFTSFGKERPIPSLAPDHGPAKIAGLSHRGMPKPVGPEREAPVPVARGVERRQSQKGCSCTGHPATINLRTAKVHPSGADRR